MRTPNLVRQFETVDTYPIINRFEVSGKYTIESEFKGVGYVIDKGTLGIIAGKNGMLSVGLENIGDLIEELKGIQELVEYRKSLGVKGA